jgi:hypothetical protein
MKHEFVGLSVGLVGGKAVGVLSVNKRRRC